VIVLDTTVLVYAVGGAHPLAAPARSVVAAIASGRLRATTTVEVIQEFVHVRARRRSREDAADLGRDFATLLAPLISAGPTELNAGLGLFRSIERLGAFDAVLAASAMAHGAAAFLSADAAFAGVPGITLIPLDAPDLADRLT
jgi:uncharacterized protein